MAELLKALSENFKDREALRLRLQNKTPFFRKRR